MEALETLRNWGYRVEEAQNVEGVPIYFVEGFGMSSYVRGDDEDTLAMLADPDAQAEREMQSNETTEQTQLRWHEDEDREFELPKEQLKAVKETVAAQEKAQEEQS